MDNSEEQEGDNYVQASNESSKKYENHPFIKSAAYDREHYDFQEFDDENGAEEQNIKTAGVLGTSLNVFSTIVGTGTLGLPAVLVDIVRGALAADDKEAAMQEHRLAHRRRFRTANDALVRRGGQ